jgi:uncharacterized OsmC-like protein
MLTPDRAEQIRAGVRARDGKLDPPNLRGLNRIQIDVEDVFRYKARNLREPGVMTVDEPEGRGGSGLGSSPLSHFLVGAGSCLLTQFARIAIAEGYDLQFDRAVVRGEFRRDPGHGFESIRCDIYASGQLPSGVADGLVAWAESHCFVYCTLKDVVRMVTVFHLNDQEAARHE